MTLKIVTWNINGIRSSQQNLRDLFDSLDADVICLQETKITRDMLDEPTAFVEGYSSYYSFSRKRSGYSGVATYCREKVTPFRAEEGIAGTMSSNLEDKIECYDLIRSNLVDDELKELDIEGRCVMTLHQFKEESLTVNLVIVNVYCPHAESDNVERLAYKLKFYKALELRCQEMLNQNFRVIVVGDINTSHRLIDHCEPEDVDNFASTPSRQWLDQFLSPSGGKFIDAFRSLHPTKEKSFTCWSSKNNARVNNYGTRIDYIFLSSQLEPFLNDCVVMSDVYGSDHCPVRAVLNVDVVPSTRIAALCTRKFKEFSGKQLKISGFVCKRSWSDVSDSASVVESESKKIKVSKQANLLNYFSTPRPSSSTSTTVSSTIVQAEVTPVLQSPKSTSNSTNSSVAQIWKSVLKGPPPAPPCSHNEPCVLRTVKKKGPNLNRQYWACPRAVGHSSDPQAQCNFFLWLSKR